MNSIAIAGLLPVALFLVIALVIAVFARRQAAAGGGGFVTEYFIGNRSLGPFVLAMTTIATYGSVSSFVGGPGQAWNIGWGWVYMATVQVTALFLLYGILGKKMALVSRRLGAVTVIDVIRERYQSNALAVLSAAILVLFFATTMIAQFVGGAKLFDELIDQCTSAILTVVESEAPVHQDSTDLFPRLDQRSNWMIGRTSSTHFYNRRSFYYQTYINSDFRKGGKLKLSR